MAEEQRGISWFIYAGGPWKRRRKVTDVCAGRLDAASQPSTALQAAKGGFVWGLWSAFHGIGMSHNICSCFTVSAFLYIGMSVMSYKRDPHQERKLWFTLD